tara:strand:+ start:4625 stop:5317 length:693 start_codon:yes stop_codon:yes gene_type:complete
MVEVESVPASSRAAVGKGPARQTRRDGNVPAVIYGNKEKPILLSLEHRVLTKQLENPQFFIKLVDIDLDGSTHRVLPREVQFHPVTDTPIHADFLRFDPERKINAAVPVVFQGEKESPGLRSGGVLNVVRYEVEVLSTADNIPQELVLDVTGLEVGDSLHASSVNLPAGVQFSISDRDFTIATIAAPTVIVETVDEDVEGIDTSDEDVEDETTASEGGNVPTEESDSDKN